MNKEILSNIINDLSLNYKESCVFIYDLLKKCPYQHFGINVWSGYDNVKIKSGCEDKCEEIKYHNSEYSCWMRYFNTNKV